MSAGDPVDEASRPTPSPSSRRSRLLVGPRFYHFLRADL